MINGYVGQSARPDTTRDNFRFLLIMQFQHRPAHPAGASPLQPPGLGRIQILSLLAV